MKSSIKLGRVFGIEISVHISWAIIGVLVMLSLASYFSVIQAGWPSRMHWGAALLATILFFISLLTHEIGHSLVAQRYGIKVRSIMLFLFGGVSQLEGEAKRPLEEFWIAIVGPLTSLAIALLFSVVSLIAGKGTFVGVVTAWLGTVNVALAVFNLLPGFPLDGGRVLRSLVWWKTGNARRATRVASEAGQMLAVLMIIGGILIFFKTGNALGGLWLAFLGWFLLDAARTGAQEIEVEQMLRGITAIDLMTRECPQVTAELPLSQFVDEYLLRTGRRCFLVTDDRRVLGIITARDLYSIGRTEWPKMVVADAMKPFNQLLWVAPDTSASRVLEIMAREGINQLPVIAEGHIQGIISREQIIELLAARMEFESGLAETSPDRSMRSKQISSRFNGAAAHGK